MGQHVSEDPPVGCVVKACKGLRIPLAGSVQPLRVGRGEGLLIW
jgi:hypothetical protein